MNCNKTVNNYSNLKSHINRLHKELEEANIEVTQNKIKWPKELVDSVIRVFTWQKKYFTTNLLKSQQDRYIKTPGMESKTHTNHHTQNGS